MRSSWHFSNVILCFFPISWNPNQTSALFSNKMESMEIGFMLEFWRPKLQFGFRVILDISGAHVFLVGICWHDVWRITASPKPELRGCWVHSLGQNDVWVNLFTHGMLWESCRACQPGTPWKSARIKAKRYWLSNPPWKNLGFRNVGWVMRSNSQTKTTLGVGILTWPNWNSPKKVEPSTSAHLSVAFHSPNRCNRPSVSPSFRSDARGT